MKNISILAAIGCVLTFAACETSYSYAGVISNKSGKDLKFLFYNGASPRVLVDSIIVANNADVIVNEQTEQGEPKNFDCLEKSIGGRGDTIVTIVVGGGTLLKPIANGNNWTSAPNTAKTYYKCTFSIAASDIQ
jgi:hypothetical protein